MIFYGLRVGSCLRIKFTSQPSFVRHFPGSRMSFTKRVGAGGPHMRSCTRGAHETEDLFCKWDPTRATCGTVQIVNDVIYGDASTSRQYWAERRVTFFVTFNAFFAKEVKMCLTRVWRLGCLPTISGEAHKQILYSPRKGFTRVSFVGAILFCHVSSKSSLTFFFLVNSKRIFLSLKK